MFGTKSYRLLNLALGEQFKTFQMCLFSSWRAKGCVCQAS